MEEVSFFFVKGKKYFAAISSKEGLSADSGTNGVVFG